MKAMCLNSSPDSPILIEHELPRPIPGPGELLIQIHAAGVTPSELAWYPTTHTKSGEARISAVPSHEFSGTVITLGKSTTGFSIGDEIYGMNDWFADGALAEYCITQPASIALKPASLTHVQAASVPIAALTAWQGLFDRAHLKAGERVLVHGAAGSVGLFAVQLAHLHGAHVIATASAPNLDFVSSLGAAQVIDYKATPFETAVRDLDVIFDTVGGETLERSWPLLNSTGRMITIASSSETPADDRTRAAFFIVEPSQTQLIEIARLLDSGQLTTIVDNIIPLSRASDAYSGRLQRETGRGKVIVGL